MDTNLNIENSTGSSAGDCFAIGGICITAVLVCFAFRFWPPELNELKQFSDYHYAP
jgi:hypothetical protein